MLERLASSKSPNSTPEIMFEDAFKTLIVDTEHPMKLRRKMDEFAESERFADMLMNIELKLLPEADYATDIL